MVILLSGVRSSAQDWKPGAGPLMTSWGRMVSPTNAWPEYPRPQLVRKDWLNLNGLWDVTLADGTITNILVPYPVESALSGVMKHSDRLTYRRVFELPKAWRRQRVLLHFGAVDWQAEVWVNGQAVGRHEGGYAPFSFDISGVLKKGVPQEVVVMVWNPSDYGTQPRGKQVSKPDGGIFYTSVSGIWQTVWLEPVDAKYLTGIQVVSDIGQKTVTFIVQAAGGKSEKVTIQCKDLGAKVSGRTGEPMVMSVPQAKLWSPDAPTLYPITVKLASGDAVESYFAMRKTSVGKDKDGITRMMLNDKFIFQHGPLDQGWWPDGLYTAPSDAAMLNDLKLVKAMGFNMLRKHIKVEPARFYYHCDQLGVLVWQDMPSMSVGGVGCNRPGANPFSEAAKANFEREWKEIIESLEFFPCIVMWTPFNEGWGQYDTERITAWTKSLDPTRLVNNASGWVDKHCGDIVDMHNYNGPAMSPVEETRASVLGEYGAFSLGFRGHVWDEKGNSVDFTPDNQNALFKPYNWASQEMRRLIGKGLSAAVYTQLTDVEEEVNGLMSYDRELMKMPLEKLAASNRALNLPPPKIKPLLPNAQEKAQRWSYTTDSVQTGTNWFAEVFDDSAWKQGLGGFGHVAEHRGAVVGTNWDTEDIWIRRPVELSAEDLAHPEELFFDLYYDEDVEIYLNGTMACKLTHGPNRYAVSPLSPQAAAALRPGKNWIAAHGSTTQIKITGWQNIDIGLSRNLP